jgi:hypothetical protein
MPADEAQVKAHHGTHPTELFAAVICGGVWLGFSSFSFALRAHSFRNVMAEFLKSLASHALKSGTADCSHKGRVMQRPRCDARA